MSHRFVRGIMLFAAVAVLIGLFLANLTLASPFVRSWDEVDFVFALDRYDLLAMQPHFPGYPYFIAGATILHQWISDPVKALITLNALLALSSAIPIALLAKRYMRLQTAAWASVWILTMPYLWLMGSRPMSECAGIAVLWWFLWSVREAAEKPRSTWRHAVALLLFSLLMGIRLSFFPFGIGLVLLWLHQYRSFAGYRARIARLILSIVSAIGAQLIWVSGLVMSEGTLGGFWKLSNAFVAGHFSEWGGGITAAEMSLPARIVKLIASNLITDVLLSRSIVIGAFCFVLLLLIVWGLGLLREKKPESGAELRYGLWLGICVAAYVLWALLGQNIEKPRHIAPIAGPLMLAFYILAIRTSQSLTQSVTATRSKYLFIAVGRGICFTLAAVVISQIVHGANLLKMQANEKPAVYQMHEYMDELKQPLIVYTWEETRVLQYLHADYEHRRILTFNYFNALADANPERKVLLTDHVLEGFYLQNASIRDYVDPIAQFSSSSLFDPVYSQITLYEWKKHN
ncbi:hypothetical protein [Cohnella abietis]|uniref:Glycosyltransferase RgtA/B/C/D-like domain-containing protein n=1 Tax=Cohnella abietis TaxID=2507935 RepID=A0A3T1CZW3_9BACL|nr:hypothetical protein [Cohnella abietis]BBI31341.1 hypothetical protein KCTCHS21_07400 [Cohnella abietis]